MSSQKMYFPAGSRIFEADGRPMGPTKWGVWALLIQRGGSPKLKEGGASPPENPQSVTLKARMFRHTYPRSGTRKFSKDRQLLIRTDALLLNGECRSLKVLVDTGAEANLVRQGLLPEHLTYPATKPLRFETANGQALGGGNVCTRLKLKLISESGELSSPENVEFDVEFYEANIKVDAILSYPWLAQAKLGIFPHHKALVLDSPGLKFLYGVRDHSRLHRPEVPENLPDCGVSIIEAVPEKYSFHLPPQGFDQQLNFLEGEDLAELAAHMNVDDPPV